MLTQGGKDHSDWLKQTQKKQNVIRKTLERNGHICVRNSGYAFDAIID